MSNPISLDELAYFLDNSEEQYVLDSIAAHGFLTEGEIMLSGWSSTQVYGWTGYISQEQLFV